MLYFSGLLEAPPYAFPDHLIRIVPGYLFDYVYCLLAPLDYKLF